MSFIPEDRLGMGLAASMGMVDNMLLKSYLNGRGPFVRRREARELAVLCERYYERGYCRNGKYTL